MTPTLCLSSGKLAFDSPQSAERRRKRIKIKRGAKSPALSVYRCQSCGAWHLGHVQRFHHHRARRVG